ncbi:MAG: electron transfer flavoprotein subunit alpha/FixB family protein [Candidatus Limivicinus sp.]
MLVKNKDVWVFIETDESGNVCGGLDLLNPAHTLAEKQGGYLTAVMIGWHTGCAAELAGEYGADCIVTVDSEELNRYSIDNYTGVLYSLIEKYGPPTVLFEATPTGKELAPRLAARAKTGLSADCVDFTLGEEGSVVWTRSVFGGSMLVTAVCQDARPQIATIRPNVFKKSASKGKPVKVLNEAYHSPDDTFHIALQEVIMDANGGKINLEDADIIVAGGRGVGGKEGFALLEELADALGGTVGASRAATDEGWAPSTSLIGQTGKSVAPRIYIACGISGALQHICGMRASDVIIAINKDASAPIFEVADYGIVGDMFKVIPALIELIKLSK